MDRNGYLQCHHLTQCELPLRKYKHSTVQYSAVQCSTVQYSTIQYNTIQYNTVQSRSSCMSIFRILTFRNQPFQCHNFLHFVDGCDESECNHVPDKPTVLAVLQFRKSLLAQPFHTSAAASSCLYFIANKIQVFVVLVEVTVYTYCYGWHVLSPWKQIT